MESPDFTRSLAFQGMNVCASPDGRYLCVSNGWDGDSRVELWEAPANGEDAWPTAPVSVYGFIDNARSMSHHIAR